MVALLQAQPECAPSYSTPRTDRPTLGAAVGRVAAMLGTPFMPWQQHVVDVAFELGDDGRLAYREVDLTVPRQSGKTTLLLAVAVHRALAGKHFGPRQQMVYTAQTRKDARKKWEEDFLEGSLKPSQAMRGKFTFKLNPGAEHIRFRNGSRFGVEATTEKAGHGGTLDLAFIDEAFAHVDGRVEQAFGPAMITRPQPQIWVNSTAGWLGASPYLWSKVAPGRASAEAGETTDVAYFEWSAAVDSDPEDPATWWSCMPALGHTVTEAAVRAQLKAMKSSPEGLNGFKRAFLNLWVPKHAPADQVIPADAWDARADRASFIDGPMVFAFDVSPERDRGAIAVAGPSGEATHLEVVADRPGTWWMVDQIVNLNERFAPAAWLVDGRSPAASLIQSLADRGVEVVTTTGTQMGRACGDLYDKATQGGIVHLGQSEVTVALAGAIKRSIGDAWGWDRRGVTNIAPLVAITLAGYGLSVYGQPSDSRVYVLR